MGFQKGQPRPPGAGRKKGSKNIKKVARVADLLADKDINPAQEIITLIDLKDDKGEFVLKPKERIDAWLDLLSYCQAKPRSSEADDDEFDDDDFSELTTADLLSIVKSTPEVV